MGKQIRLNEDEFNALIEESVMRFINEGVDEEMEEGAWNKMKAFGKSFADMAKGGNFKAHYQNNLSNMAKQDMTKLKDKYGVADGQNRYSYANSESKAQIEQIRQKYQAKIDELTQQMNAEIAKVKQKNINRFEKYQGKKKELNKDFRTAERKFQKYANQDPYGRNVQ